MLDPPSKLLCRPARLSSSRDPLEWHKKRGYRPRPRVPHHSKFKQLRKYIRWNCIGIFLQTEMFVARAATLDAKSVDSVLKNGACEFVFTVTRKNALNRIASGSRDMYASQLRDIEIILAEFSRCSV